MNDTMNERDYVNPVDIHRTYIQKVKISGNIYKRKNKFNNNHKY